MPRLLAPESAIVFATTVGSDTDFTAASMPFGGVTSYVVVGVAGDLKVVMADGSTVVLPGLPAGKYPLACKKVFASGTTATKLSFLF